jgi:hypothetical protein
LARCESRRFPPGRIWRRASREDVFRIRAGASEIGAGSFGDLCPFYRTESIGASKLVFDAQWLAYAIPCQRFASPLTGRMADFGLGLRPEKRRLIEFD